MSRPPADGAARAEVKHSLGLDDIPLPESVFADNVLELANPKLGIRIEFKAKDALASWQQNQDAQRLKGKLSKSEHDWTYSSPYSGSIAVDKAVLREKLRLARRIEAPEFGVPVSQRKAKRARRHGGVK